MPPDSGRSIDGMEKLIPGGALAEMWAADEARGINPRSIERQPDPPAPPLPTRSPGLAVMIAQHEASESTPLDRRAAP